MASNASRPASAAAPAAAPKQKENPAGARALAMVLRAAPALWNKTCERERVASVRHAEFKRSLVWLMQKERFEVRENAPASYYTQAGIINGKVDLVASWEGQDVLAIEVDFRATPSSGWKLLGKRREGLLALLIVGFSPDLSSARETANSWFSKPTQHWLALGLLPSPLPRPSQR